MYRRYADRQPRLKSNFLGLLVLVALLATSVGTSAAQQDSQPAASDLHTIVASDGVTPEALPTSESRRQRWGVSTPFAGTDILPLLPAADLDAANEVAVAPVLPGDQVSPESVIGPDGRYRITATTSYPYRAIAFITSNIGSCSGWLIGPDTVATAGHCIHNGNWASNVRVYPGRSSSSTPYGSCGATRLYSVTGWTRDRNRDYDYGAIKLNCDVGDTTGWFGFRWQSSSMNGQSTYLAGYPGDKSYATMWRHDDQVRETRSRRLYYANDTYGGQSGSPVWNGRSNCSPCGIAIHAYGRDSTGYNGGTRITEAVFNNLLNWKNAPK
ncbi:MAG: serine protease [Chloroflexales bacterium]|nr:serine protease [Chloroflexales bacterium]